MASASMTEEDQSGGSQSNTVFPTGYQISLDSGIHSVKSFLLKDQFTSGDDYAPKVRKPYTITKQRERWTQEEHKKFLEALKLYGRAWRRIEEHVGTKTAVQIRSHAQKFFSKVVRESSGSDENSVKPIEIPPPRPKRKPMHPYPRKMLPPLKTGTRICEQQTRSTSPNLSVSEQENQSPTSVLSAVCSDTLGTDSNTPKGSPSPVSSAAGVKSNGFLSEPNLSPEENGSSSPVQKYASLTPDEQVSMKLELFPQDTAFGKEGSAEASSTQSGCQSLKLFGKTVLVTESYKPSSPTMGTCKSPPPDKSDGAPEPRLSLNLIPLNYSLDNAECGLSASPREAPAALYYMQFPNKSSDLVEGGSAAFLPWWNLYGGVRLPFLQLHNPVVEKPHPSSDGKEAQDMEFQKDRSWTGSNTGSVNVGGDGDKNWDVETQSRHVSRDKEENEQKPELLFKPSEELGLSERRRKPNNCIMGFVPYKRCLAERDTYSSTITGEEREERRIRLCL